MKYLLITALLLPSFVFAQSGKRDILDPNQLAVKELKLGIEKTLRSETKLPFEKIKIIDSRYDTSKIGYITLGSFFSSKTRFFKKLVLQDGTGKAIENYYNECYAGSFTKNGFELLVVIKRLWISGDTRSNSKRVELTNAAKTNDNLYCKWEYYIGKDGKYLPVKRVDSIIQVGEDFRKFNDMVEVVDDEGIVKKTVSFLKFTLRGLIEFLDYSNAIRQFDSQTKKTLPEINEFNERMHKMPILQEGTIKKGVYLTFDEFKNNRPSIVDFREKKMRYKTINTEIYLENMNGETISNYWGYSDGEKFRYGMLGNDKLYRIQNTFCFFIKVESYAISSGNDAGYGGSGINTTSKNKYHVWVPYQIDMETGEIY